MQKIMLLFAVLLLTSACPILNYYPSTSLQRTFDLWAAANARFSERTISETVPENLRDIAIAYINDLLDDPESASYRFDFLSTRDNLVGICGAVNSRNRSGNYIGFRQFYVEVLNNNAVSGGVINLMPNTEDLIAVCGLRNPNNPAPPASSLVR